MIGMRGRLNTTGATTTIGMKTGGRRLSTTFNVMQVYSKGNFDERVFKQPLV